MGKVIRKEVSYQARRRGISVREPFGIFEITRYKLFGWTVLRWEYPVQFETFQTLEQAELYAIQLAAPERSPEYLVQ